MAQTKSELKADKDFSGRLKAVKLPEPTPLSHTGGGPKTASKHVKGSGKLAAAPFKKRA
jgi:hypothetical protein